jgi:hypothetical protein
MAETRHLLISADTSPAMAERQFEMPMALPPERRVLMAASMFDSAREIMVSDLAARGIPKHQWPGEIFRRTYAPDFDLQSLNQIAEHLNTAHSKA